jgi:murein DD-endopeptidase MepM/ murein hydrolase activator NlpD
MTRHIGKSLLVLLATLGVGSLIHFNGASSVAHANLHVDLPIPPLARLADSLHSVTLQLDDKIAELSALDSTIANRCALPVISDELREMSCTSRSIPTFPAVSIDAFVLNNRITSQESFIDQLTSVVQKRLTMADELPTLTPCNGVHTSGFGMRVHPITGVEKGHTGMDIAAPTGTPIHASGNGVVVFAGVKSGYGNCIEIDHGYGYHTLYGHASKLIATVGQQINRGDKIALVGSTGMSTGPHLHYEVIVDGTKVDPAHFLIDPLEEAPSQPLAVVIAKK